MVRSEYYKTRRDGVILFRYYSDAGAKIRQVETNKEYTQAIDVKDAPYSYEETDIKIKTAPLSLESLEERMDALEDAIERGLAL